MFNKYAKYLIVLSGLTPILLVLWLVRTIQHGDQLTFYWNTENWEEFKTGMLEMLVNHWLLLAFLVTLWFCNSMMNRALKRLSPFDIQAKSLKPAEVNFTPLLFTVMAGWLKYYFTDVKDLIFLIGTLAICLLYALVFRDSYHYNIVYKVFFGYRYYEIQVGNVTYLLLSRQMVYDTTEIKTGIKISDYMIINTTPPLNKQSKQSKK